MRKNNVYLPVVLLGLLLLLSGCGEKSRMLVGVHVQDCDYEFTEGMLAESSEHLRALGADGIGIYLGPDYIEYYPELANSGATSLIELAETEQIKAIFSESYSVYSITCYAFANSLERTKVEGPLTLDDKAAYEELREFSEYLLRTYGGSNKIIIIKNWEADWHLLGSFDFNLDPTEEDIAYLLRWLQARVNAVADAKAEFDGQTSLKLYSAVEFNHVTIARSGRPRVLNRIIPHLNADLYSYSSWDMLFLPDKLIENLDYIAELAPDSEAFGNRNIMIGEIGAPDEHKSKIMMEHLALEAANSWGVPYCFYWQLYDNECDEKVLDPADVELRRGMTCRGYSLIDRFGVKTPSWYLLERFIASIKTGNHKYEDIYAGK